MNNKYLVAIDSDGTLRHSDGTISKRTKNVIKKLISNGHIITICTGRPRYHTLKISNEVGITNYLISSNGTEVYDNINNKIIYAAYLSNDICKKIYEDTKSRNIRAIFVSENTEYATKFVRNDSQVLLTDENIEFLNNQIKQIMIIDNNKELVKKYKEEIEDQYNLNVMNSSYEDNEEVWFSIASNAASKGIALEKLAEYLNIPISNTIAIGNDINDISMFKKAGTSVCVSNATEDIKKEATCITSSNDQDGVAEYLEKLLK